MSSRSILAGLLLVCCIAPSVTSGQPFLPERERRILDLIADEMQLTPEERRLLMAIRKHENGRPGKECGVLYRNGGDELQPYLFWPLSLMENGCLCAEKIRRKYRGNLKRFSAWYAPIDAKNDPQGLNKCWYPTIKAYMRQLKNEETKGE